MFIVALRRYRYIVQQNRGSIRKINSSGFKITLRRSQSSKVSVRSTEMVITNSSNRSWNKSQDSDDDNGNDNDNGSDSDTV